MYDKILVAVDFSPDYSDVIDKALSQAEGDSSKLHLVHIVEPLAPVYSMDIYTVNIGEIQDGVVDSAKQRLEKIGSDLGIGVDRVYTRLGNPAAEIRNIASEINADAIVIGSHGHSGWKIFLGSTAAKVLHGAKCDVLVVKVGSQ